MSFATNKTKKRLIIKPSKLQLLKQQERRGMWLEVNEELEDKFKTFTTQEWIYGGTILLAPCEECITFAEYLATREDRNNKYFDEIYKYYERNNMKNSPCSLEFLQQAIKINS
tara:strand:- start:204 stop:542 length:339 start_codon:yes stop_codon:yes gene_type:complete